MPTTPVTWLQEFTVNTTTAAAQTDPDIIQLENGVIVVSWTSTATIGPASPALSEVIAQRFDPVGGRIGGEFRLNTDSTINAEQDADMARLPNGGFLAVYEDDESGANGGHDIRIERYDATGAAVSGVLIQPDDTNALANYYNPRIAVASATSALVVYDQEFSYADDRYTTITYRTYNPATNAFGDAQYISVNTEYFNPHVTALANGSFVVAYQYLGSAPGMIGWSIVNGSGVETASGFISGTGNDNDEDYVPTVTALSGGGFVVAWTDTDNNTEVLAQVFTVVGVETGPRIAIGDAADPQEFRRAREVTPLGDGGFLVFIEDEELDQLQVRRYGADGVQIGAQFVVSDGDNVSGASATLLKDGRIAVAFQRQDGEIGLEILDIRDPVNVGVVTYGSSTWQIGVVGDESRIAEAEIFHGGGGGDSIFESATSREIYGDDGDDIITISGVDPDELVDGGAGNDLLYCFDLPAGTVIDLAAGTMVGGLFGQAALNFENVLGGRLAERLLGTAGANGLYGNAGDDTLEGRAGGDSLEGGDGFDFASYTDAMFAIRVVRYDATYNTGDAAGDSYFSIEGIHGSGFGDTLVGGFGVDVIGGGGGGDWIDGTAGADALYGEEGNDNLASRAGAQLLDGGADFDLARYDYADSGLRAYLYDRTQNSGWAAGDIYGSIEGLAGSYFADDLRGDASQNIIYGLGGDDFIVGLGGSDLLIGGDGQDLFHFVGIGDGGAGGDAIQDFVSGQDRISVTGAFFGLGSPGGVAIESFRFVAGSAANLATSQFLYNAPTGQFWYDQDGTGAGAQVLLATLQAGATMAAEDIIVL